MLPFGASAPFGAFFNALDGDKDKLNVLGYSVAITDLEEVFLRVGEDSAVKRAGGRAGPRGRPRRR